MIDLAGMTILVVDDDDTFRSRLAAAIAARGLSVREAASAGCALEIAAEFDPELAVVDLRMPGASGLELIPRLVEACDGIRIVVLTGYGSIATAVSAVRLGAVHYLTKPTDVDSILRALSMRSDGAGGSKLTTPSLERVEWEHIQRVLHDCGGNISRAAKSLGIHRRSLQRKLTQFPPSS